MKQPFYLLTILFLLMACAQKSRTLNSPKAGAVTVIADTLKGRKAETKAKKVLEDTLLFYTDDLYSELALKFTAIQAREFEAYKRAYKTACILDAGQFIRGSALYVSQSCDEVCATYLCEKATNRKMLLPSNYDAGVLKLLLSPACKQLIVCSSYDGPDYADYYEDRAEIFVLDVTTGAGLKGIKPAFRYYTKDWSIADLTWVNDKTIALKIYEGRSGDSSSVHYVKTVLKK
jgi:hypothetical protein